MQLKTIHGHDLSVVVSALQKAIRRGDARLAGYFALEMWTSGYGAYCWRRLLTVSAEDCWGVITQEILALQQAYDQINRGAKKQDGRPARGRIFLAKAVLLLCAAKKCRDPDHLTNYVYDRELVDAQQLVAAIMEAKAEPIPEYAYDVHTAQGKRRGKTKAQFFQEEQAALFPRAAGELDDVLEQGQAEREEE